jgi:hypothetical protein
MASVPPNWHNGSHQALKKLLYNSCSNFILFSWMIISSSPITECKLNKYHKSIIPTKLGVCFFGCFLPPRLLDFRTIFLRPTILIFSIFELDREVHELTWIFPYITNLLFTFEQKWNLQTIFTLTPKYHVILHEYQLILSWDSNTTMS